MKNLIGKLKIGNVEMSTLLAISQAEQEKGLMHQKWPPPIMTFVYHQPKINKFWMHNTPSPLDIVFCSKNKIFNICKGEPYSTALIGDDNPSDLVIELPYGTCKSSGFKIGDTIALDYENYKNLSDNYSLYLK